ncbi:MAG: adenylate kinase [Alphaproteobacteria bacterium]|nr:adenylate kinase [Alphaproteobacteria bacterium]
MARHNRIVLLGPPGSGKGTQGAILAQNMGVHEISAGDLLRTEVKTGSNLGKEIAECINAGHLVSTDLIVRLMTQAFLAPENENGFISDGFPRSIEQAEIFEKVQQQTEFTGKKVDLVLLIDVPDSYILERILGRFQCPSCGTFYHDKFKPTKVAGVCDICGGKEFAKRADDTEETVVSRLRVYREATAPLIPYYEKQGLLVRVDGTGSIDAVSEKIKEIVGY